MVSSSIMSFFLAIARSHILLHTATAWSGSSAVLSSITIGMQRCINSPLLSPSLGVGMDFYPFRQIYPFTLFSSILADDLRPGIYPAPGIGFQAVELAHLCQ